MLKKLSDWLMQRNCFTMCKRNLASLEENLDSVSHEKSCFENGFLPRCLLKNKKNQLQISCVSSGWNFWWSLLFLFLHATQRRIFFLKMISSVNSVCGWLSLKKIYLVAHVILRLNSKYWTQMVSQIRMGKIFHKCTGSNSVAMLEIIWWAPYYVRVVP